MFEYIKQEVRIVSFSWENVKILEKAMCQQRQDLPWLLYILIVTLQANAFFFFQ